MEIINEYFTKYYESNYKDFILNYEISLSKFTEILRWKSIDFDDLSSLDIERDFVKELIKSVSKKNNELLIKSNERDENVFKEIGTTEDEYFNLMKSTNNEDIERFKEYHEKHIEASKKTPQLNEKELILLNHFNYKIHFLNNKLNKTGFLYRVSNNETIVFNETSKDRKKSNLLISGKIPNISERYKIANEILDVYKTINEKNISATEKHILLAHILGCSQQVARELFNGTQQKRTPTRDEVINPYLKKLE